MSYPSLSGHVQELLDELDYWTNGSDIQTPNLKDEDRREFLMHDIAKRKVAAENCRQEIEDAVMLLRQNGF